MWPNVTWLSALGLEAARCGGMREYLVPDSGRGPGARDFAA